MKRVPIGRASGLRDAASSLARGEVAAAGLAGAAYGSCGEANLPRFEIKARCPVLTSQAKYDARLYIGALRRPSYEFLQFPPSLRKGGEERLIEFLGLDRSVIMKKI